MATTIAAFVGTTLQPASPLRPQYRHSSSPSSMRHRRFSSVTPSTGSTWQMQSFPSLRISGKSGSSSSAILMGSPFENYNKDNEIDSLTMENVVNETGSTTANTNNDIDSNNASLLDRDNSSTADTLVTDDDLDLNYNTANSTMTTISVLSKENIDAKEPDTFFSIPLGALKETMNIDEEEGRRLAIPSEKFMQYLKEETPPLSVVLLNIVAVIWGSQHAIIKTIVDDSDPAAFTFLRFGLGSLIASPYLPGVQQTVRKTTNKIKSFATKDDYNNDHKKDEIDLWKPWRWGIEMGLWMFLGFSLQAIGLQTTTAQRSGFLLYLNVKFVPFFAKVLLGRQISKWTWLSAFAAFSGTALLALDGQSLGLNIGDIWSVMAAAASAMFILRLEKASSEVPKSSELNATSLLVVAMLSGAWLLLSGSGEQIASEVTRTAFAHPLELVYLGAISTALANFIQAKAQKDVPAERASIIYSLDPVYGAFFSWIILGETLGGPQAYIGASIIFVAAATNSVLEFSKSDKIKE